MNETIKTMHAHIKSVDVIAILLNISCTLNRTLHKCTCDISSSPTMAIFLEAVGNHTVVILYFTIIVQQL